MIDIHLQPTRRCFLERSSRLAALTAAATALGGVHTFASGRDEKIRLGIIGCGGIMHNHVEGLTRRRERVSLAWLCDVDPGQIERLAGKLEASSGRRQSGRYEDVIEDPAVDAVIIATPHHWHAPIAIAAMAAGKHVYVEKPISHVFQEGPLMIAAANKYQRVLQHGSQMRSSPVTDEAQQLLQSGILGEIKVAKAWTAEQRIPLPPVPDSDVPSGVDYDRWLGPAAQRAFNQQRFHVLWRMFRDYGNGEIGDDGIHDLDMACWGLGVDTLPHRVTVRGSRMLLHGHYSEYPDNMVASYDYPDGKLLIYENYPFTSYGLHGFDNGNVFYGTEGYMIFSRRGAFRVFLGPKGEPGPSESREIRGERGYQEHMSDFLTAVRTRNRATRAPVDVAHRSSALVHLADIAYQTSGQLKFDAAAERFVDCDEANALLSKTYRPPYELPTIL